MCLGSVRARQRERKSFLFFVVCVKAFLLYVHVRTSYLLYILAMGWCMRVAAIVLYIKEVDKFATIFFLVEIALARCGKNKVIYKCVGGVAPSSYKEKLTHRTTCEFCYASILYMYWRRDASALLGVCYMCLIFHIEHTWVK